MSGSKQAPGDRDRPDRGAMRRRRLALFAASLTGAAVVVGVAIASGGNWLPIAAGAVGWVLMSFTAIEHRVRRRRCKACGREDAMRRVGRRRIGYVRMQYRYCGAKSWGTIPEEEAIHSGDWSAN
jgi:hypothetical protein